MAGVGLKFDISSAFDFCLCLLWACLCKHAQDNYFTKKYSLFSVSWKSIFFGVDVIDKTFRILHRNTKRGFSSSSFNSIIEVFKYRTFRFFDVFAKEFEAQVRKYLRL